MFFKIILTHEKFLEKENNLFTIWNFKIFEVSQLLWQLSILRKLHENLTFENICLGLVVFHAMELKVS